jgi:hypothetical protein
MNLTQRERIIDQTLRERLEVCCICRRQAYQLPDGEWNTSFVVEVDSDGAWLRGDGDHLIDAATTPSGWACSLPCRSQAMYNQACEHDKQALDTVRDACSALMDWGPRVLDMLADHLDETFPSELLSGAQDFYRIAGCEDAAWANRPPRVEALEKAASELLEVLKEEAGSQECMCEPLKFIGGVPPCRTCQLRALVTRAEGRK